MGPPLWRGGKAEANEILSEWFDELQWGRPCGGAERLLLAVETLPSTCFNGAAPVEGRKAACLRIVATSQ